MKNQKSSKKKVVTAVVATVMAAALLLGGTFAWQSISQTALNETGKSINPGGRLHDDFDGSNKDIYVENFADENIYARVRLDEYFEVIANKGTPAESVKVITAGATKGDTSTYVTHKFDSENVTDNYWNWTTGGQTKYMPTFNKNKDSLAADINGTYEQDFDDYVDYNTVDVEVDGAIYDNDENDIEDDGVTTIQETHNTKDTEAASLISMSDWLQRLESGENTDNYWVYDTDGWVYWSSPIAGNTATGLLLDKIQLSKVMDDSYYYAINVTAQFITADDIGKTDSTGFYTDSNQIPSSDALLLLEKIGVNVPEENTTIDYVTDRLSISHYSNRADVTLSDTNRAEAFFNLRFDGAWMTGTEIGPGMLPSTGGMDEPVPTGLKAHVCNNGDTEVLYTAETSDMSCGSGSCNFFLDDLGVTFETGTTSYDIYLTYEKDGVHYISNTLTFNYTKN